MHALPRYIVHTVYFKCILYVIKICSKQKVVIVFHALILLRFNHYFVVEIPFSSVLLKTLSSESVRL